MVQKKGTLAGTHFGWQTEATKEVRTPSHPVKMLVKKYQYLL
jgi:hypothetical protein